MKKWSAGPLPERLFALLKLEPVPESILDRVSDGVAAGIARDERRPPARRLVAWGSIAASLLLAGVFGTYLWMGEDEAPPPEGAVRTADPARTVPGDAAVPASMIEVLDSPGKADVVQVTVGDTELVMIFDEALDL